MPGWVLWFGLGSKVQKVRELEPATVFGVPAFVKGTQQNDHINPVAGASR